MESCPCCGQKDPTSKGIHKTVDRGFKPELRRVLFHVSNPQRAVGFVPVTPGPAA